MLFRYRPTLSIEAALIDERVKPTRIFTAITSINFEATWTNLPQLPWAAVGRAVCCGGIYLQVGRLSLNCESGHRLIMKFLSVIATSLCLAGRASVSMQTRRTFLVLNSGNESVVGTQKYSRWRCDVSVSVSWVLQYVWSAVFGDFSFLHWIHSAHDGRESQGHDPPLAPRLRIQRAGFCLSQARSPL